MARSVETRRATEMYATVTLRVNWQGHRAGDAVTIAAKVAVILVNRGDACW
jgi:hypothetical protein